MIVSKKHINLNQLFSISIVLLPFLHQYRGIGATMSLGELLVGLFTALLFIQDNFRLKTLDTSLLIFYVITIITTAGCAFSNYFNISAASTVIVRLIFYALVVNVARKHFDLLLVDRVYINLVGLFSLYLIAQFVSHEWMGIYLPIYLKYSWQFPPEMRSENLSVYFQWHFRASSLFLEPSYYVLYVLLGVILLLFKKKQTKRERMILAATIVAVLMSTASSGVLGILIIFTIFFFRKADNSNKSRRLSKVGIVLAFVVLVSLYFAFAPNAEFLITRLMNGGSINQRITRGIIVFRKLPLIHQIIGVGINNLESFMIKNGISTIFDESNLNYASSFVQTLNYSGILGLVSLALYNYQLFVKMKKAHNHEHITDVYASDVGLTMFFIILFIMTYESILFTYRFAFIIVLYEGAIAKQSSRKGENNFEKSSPFYRE